MKVPASTSPACLCSRPCRLNPFKRQTSADKLRQFLGPKEGRLQDLCQPVGRLKALAEDNDGANSVSGIWKKDKSLCDSMDTAFEAVKLPWIYRKAVGFLNYLEIEDTDEHFRTILKAGGLMDVVEQYPWSGETVVHKRRDKRLGHHTGRVVRTPEGPQIQVAWEDPFGGKGTDTFTVRDNTLTQTSVMELADPDKSCTYRTVYRRVRSRDN